MTESLKSLLDLQEIDLARDRLEERKEKLPQKDELAQLEQRMAEVRAAIGRVEEHAEQTIREINKLEGEIRIIDEKIAREEKRLYGGEVVNPKELSALQEEIAMLRRRKAPQEEEELEKLMQRDELAAEKESLQGELADLGREADGVKVKIEALTRELDAELEVENAKRSELLAQLPSDVVDRYEDLRGLKKGVGVGALQNGVCSACREALSAVEVDRIKKKVREGEQLFRCEHCRRLLVVV